MDFAFTEEHEELRRAVRRFLAKESSEDAVRATMESERGFDSRVWERMATEMALPGLAIAERYGGAGLGPVELAIVMEEMGGVLYCRPYFSTAVLAFGTLGAAADEPTREKKLPEIAAGRMIATVVTAGVRAVGDKTSSRLEGEADFVLDGHAADVILVAAPGDGGVALYRVDGAASRLERALLPTLDLTRKLARLRFDGTPAERVSTGDAASGVRRAAALAATALSAEETGGAQRCPHLATGYRSGEDTSEL